MPRFCWRERTERVNWRLLRNLQLADIVRRGDATLLEPYALHLTFAKLPVVVAAVTPSRRDVLDDDTALSDDHHHARNAWFIVRVFQLAMEYLLFLRARDGAVVDSLREELFVCERECELLVERARKWKDRSRSGERQVEKLHQVLQSIAKLLQIEGATPNAVATMETLLRDLVPSGVKKRSNSQPEPTFSHVEEARVCALCGKMFSSQSFLDKHAIRRHPRVEMKTFAGDEKSRTRHGKRATEDAASNQLEVRTDQANEMKTMLQQVEQTLQEHKENLRSVAHEEADRLHNLYQQLHVETQLAEEMRAKRLAVEKKVEHRRHELEAIEQEKDDVAEEIRVMREQLQFLGMKKTIETRNGGSSLSPPIQHDPTLQLELKRLEETVAMMNEALSTAREELQRSHEIQGALLKEKGALEAQFHETRNHALRLEASLRRADDQAPTMHADVGVQATTAVISSMVQTYDIELKPRSPSAAVEPVLTRAPAGEEIAVQTDAPIRSDCIDTMMQTDPEAVSLLPPVELVRTQSVTASIGVGVDDDLLAADEELDSVFKVKCASLLDLVQRRAETSAHAKSTAAVNGHDDEKVIISLSRRRYLRSRFAHNERVVADRIASHVTKLEQASLRYGVSPKSLVLSNEHVEVVQRALHAHLEVLPSDVLQRMIDMESTVNELIRTHWMPQEKSWQHALERLTAGLEAKSQSNQGLVRQAMVAFASGINAETNVRPTDQSAATAEEGEKAAVSARTEPSSEAVAVPKNEVVDNREDLLQHGGNQPAIAAENVVESVVRDERQSSFLLLFPATMQIHTAPASEPDQRDSEPAMSLDVDVSSDADSSPLVVVEQSLQLEREEPSPLSVQQVRRQAHSVKVVSVTQKSSPAKSPPRSSSQYREVITSERTATTPADVDEEILRTRAVDSSETNEIIADVTANIIDITFASKEPTQPPGTSVMHSRAPSSFSAKHPESQLGIVIPSRYDPSVINVAGLQNDMGLDSGSDVSHTPAGHALRWSSSVGRSGGASERSFSAVASSEISFAASIPSLGSEDEGVSRHSRSSPTEQLPTILSKASGDEFVGTQDDAFTNIRGIASIEEEKSDSEKNTEQTLATEEQVAPPSPQQHSPQHGFSPTEIMTFDDDDSDIEEVMLA